MCHHIFLTSCIYFLFFLFTQFSLTFVLKKGVKGKKPEIKSDEWRGMGNKVKTKGHLSRPPLQGRDGHFTPQTRRL